MCQLAKNAVDYLNDNSKELQEDISVKLIKGGTELYQKKLGTDFEEGTIVRLRHKNSFIALGKVMEFDDPGDPSIMEDFIRAIGAEPVDYANRNECCGGYVTLEAKSLAKAKSNVIVNDAVANGAEMLITACPLCKYNLVKSGADIPVVYFTELLAEALGVKEDTNEQ